MSSKDNERHLKQILYREAFERREADPQDAIAEADARASMEFDPAAKWLRARQRIEHRLDALGKRLAPIHVDVRIAQAKPHAYTPHEYPSIGHLRLVLFEGGMPTTKSLEFDVSENGVVHLYTYLATGTRRADMDLDELDDERIETVLLDFVDWATR
ncbi:MAG: hypothetical protein K0R61_3641 [Microvirga sp.]|jgi:hypothetical protein|nr:hypothetical protein [Microvirga sp.]MDF2689081.1 hypothetical protein [Microvirga sp.]MDF2973191.1 hypothetical protein [Microvirga sp.]